MPWSTILATRHAARHAQPKSIGLCAKYVRLAIAAGGVKVTPTLSAKNYGPHLVAAGFKATAGTPQSGDVIVIQSIPGHPHGHMAIYDGRHWFSDFKQLRGFYPGPGYRSLKPAYKIYRHD